MTGPPPIAAILGGLRYQVRHFWHHALPMLYDATIAKVVVEHRGIPAVDDVVVFYVPPGVNEAGARIDVDFHQVKFHVAQSGAVDHESVTDPAWTGTQQSLLQRFCSAWKQIRPTHPAARLNLVTNWPWNPSSPLAALISDGGRLRPEFLTAGGRSKVGQIRQKWQEVCGLDEGEFASFAGSLRFSTAAVSQDRAEAWLRDRCQLAGLVPIEPSIDWSPYDDLGKRLIESGRTEHTPDSLRKLMSEQGLIQKATPPFRSTLAVRSFKRFAHVPTTDGACVVDLTDLFQDRNPVSDAVWETTVRERLTGAIPEIGKLEQPVHVALDAHLSIAWYAGSILDPKSGISVVLRQPVKGKAVQLWEVTNPIRPDGAAAWTSTLERIGDGPELAVVVSVTHNALDDAKRCIEGLPAVGRILHMALPAGPAVVVDGGHARWLADELARTVRQEIAQRPPEHTRLFPACPASLMFLIGQEARTLGPTTVYEFAFGQASRAYRAGMTTDTK
jgi:hypothetical protein